MIHSKRHLYYTLMFCCGLVCSCNWLEEKKEQVEDEVSQKVDEYVLEPIAEGIYEVGEEIFSPAYDSVVADEYCEELRPNPLRPVSFENVSEVGYQNYVLSNTTDSVLPHLDASFFEQTEEFFPLNFPYYLDYSGKTLDYFHLEIGYCEYSDLIYEYGIYPYKEIFQMAISEQYLLIVTYDDDLSFMSPTKDGVMYYILNLEKHEHYEYSNQDDFDLARNEIANSTDALMSPTDFIEWYENYNATNEAIEFN